MTRMARFLARMARSHGSHGSSLGSHGSLARTLVKLGYPDRLVNATVTLFLNSVFLENDQAQKNNATSEGNILQVVLHFKDKRLRTSFVNSLKILAIQTVFTSPIQTVLQTVQKLASNLKFRRGNHLSSAKNALYINLNVIL